MPTFAEKEQAKRDRVQEMVAERAKRTPKDQLKVLDFRLGKDQGAKRERERLKNLMNNVHKKVEEPVEVVQMTEEEIKAARELRKAEKKAAKKAAKE